jgi:DNA-binding transcriptional LysR family regulator
VKGELDRGSLVVVLPDYQAPSRSLHVLYARDRRVTPKLRSFLDFAREHFGA